MIFSVSESAAQLRRIRGIDPILVGGAVTRVPFLSAGHHVGTGRMLESRSNSAAWFARATAGQLHEAAVSHLFEPCIRCLASKRSVENGASADGKNENREFGKVGRITTTDHRSLPRHSRTRLQYWLSFLRKIFCRSDRVCLSHERWIHRLRAFPHR